MSRFCRSARARIAVASPVKYLAVNLSWPGVFCAGLLGVVMPASAQTGAKNGEWRTYGGDLGNTRYSPLDQINASNFDKLEVAWRFNTANLSPGPEFNLEATPLMVGGKIYSVAGSQR